jgi:hypothetical protein
MASDDGPWMGRTVSFAEGEETFTEHVYRYTFADGTSVDTPPIRAGQATGLGSLADVAASIASASRKVNARVQRLERTVTVYTSPWVPVNENDPAEDGAR